MSGARSAAASFLMLAFALGLPATGQTIGAQDKLNQSIAEFQKNVKEGISTSELRKNIIKLVLTMDPKPAIPAEAEKYAAQADRTFLNAKSPSDFAEAAKGYGQALFWAPWVARYYFNRGLASEKAERPQLAATDYGWYLLAAPNAPDAPQVQKRIAELRLSAGKTPAVKESTLAPAAADTRRAPAASLSDQLKQCVKDLKKNPNDVGLRETIIKLAQQMNPPPITPAEAQRFMARGAAALKEAKTADDFKEAAAEFEEAALAAPWVAEAYGNLGAAQEKAGLNGRAIQSLKLCLFAAPNATNANDVRKHLGEIEKSYEERQKQAAEERTRQNHEVLAQLRKTLGGVDFVCRVASEKKPVGIAEDVPGYGAFPGTGVNERQLQGMIWWDYLGGNKITERCIFEEDRVLFCSVGEDGSVNRAIPDLIGTPNGPGLEHLIWEHLNPSDKVNRRVWGRIFSDGSVRWSPDRPIDETEYDVNHTYHYWAYYRR